MQEIINDKLSFQPYNGMRPQLAIPEYGRNIQRMVEHAVSLEDREERNKCVKAIISVMGQLFPHLRDIEDYNHKLWDHLHIISDFKLDVDSPYPKPEATHLRGKPDRMDYPQSEIAFRHYGFYVEKMIDKCAVMEEGEERKAFALSIANLMKYNATNWNRNIIHDDVILKDLLKLSKGRISLENEIHLQSVKPIVAGGFKDYDMSKFSKSSKFKGKNKNKNRNKGMKKR